MFRNKVIVNQIPHHGSFENWNESFLSDFGSYINIISAGVSNRYGHPSKSVLMSIWKERKFSFWVDEKVWFLTKGKVWWGNER
jgi:beta-lactamase superfamily II metal-dependent hydrolase